MEIELRNVSFSYEKKKKRQSIYYSIENIQLTIRRGEFVAIGGHSGSGKSTLTQIMKGLLSPSEGEIYLDGINPVKQKRPELFDAIGFAFQYPEHQLFAPSVYEDIAFGPKKQLQIKESDHSSVRGRVRTAMDKVNLDFNRYKDRHPLELSGGEKRRAALAGVLALEPEILILDEPTVGMDFPSRQALFEVLRQLNKEGVTIIMVTHRWEEMLAHANRFVVIHAGKKVADDDPLSILSDDSFLEQYGLEQLDCIALHKRLLNMGCEEFSRPWDIRQAAAAILSHPAIKKRKVNIR